MFEKIQWHNLILIDTLLLRHFPYFAAGHQETAEAVIFKVGFAVVGLAIRSLFGEVSI
jgi:hypothetical protein